MKNYVAKKYGEYKHSEEVARKLSEKMERCLRLFPNIVSRSDLVEELEQLNNERVEV